jgi:hypothetical protein
MMLTSASCKSFQVDNNQYSEQIVIDHNFFFKIISNPQRISLNTFRIDGKILCKKNRTKNAASYTNEKNLLTR